MFQRFLCLGMSCLMSAAALAQSSNDFIENKTLAQYYLWFQAFERTKVVEKVPHHLAILSEDVDIVSSGGRMTGHHGVEGFLGYVFYWQNAHHIESTEVTRLDDNTLKLEAFITYQNIQQGDRKNQMRLHYQTELSDAPGELPVFTSLSLLPVETQAPETYRDAYETNRTLSFIHAWLAMEEGGIEPGLVLPKLTQPALQDVARTRLTNIGTQHQLVDYSVESVNDNEWSITARVNIGDATKSFRWRAIEDAKAPYLTAVAMNIE